MNTEQQLKTEKVKQGRKPEKSFQELKWYEYLMGAVMIMTAARTMVLGFTTGAADGNPAWLTVINFISAVCRCHLYLFLQQKPISAISFLLQSIPLFTQSIWFIGISGEQPPWEILFYIPMNFISWYYWAKHRDEQITRKTKSKTSDKAKMPLVRQS